VGYLFPSATIYDRLVPIFYSLSYPAHHSHIILTYSSWSVVIYYTSVSGIHLMVAALVFIYSGVLVSIMYNSWSSRECEGVRYSTMVTGITMVTVEEWRALERWWVGYLFPSTHDSLWCWGSHDLSIFYLLGYLSSPLLYSSYIYTMVSSE